MTHYNIQGKPLAAHLPVDPASSNLSLLIIDVILVVLITIIITGTIITIIIVITTIMIVIVIILHINDDDDYGGGKHMIRIRRLTSVQLSVTASSTHLVIFIMIHQKKLSTLS